MRKFVSIIFVILLFVIMGSGVCFISSRYNGMENDMEDISLQAFNYHYSGDMKGGSYFLEVEKNGNQSLITVSNSESWNQKPVKKTIKVDIDLLKDIDILFKENHLEKEENAPLSEIIALDSGSGMYDFVYADHIYTFNTDKVYSDSTWNTLLEIRQMVEGYIE